MSDGPFKNLKLPRRWKLFSEAVQTDAFDTSYCCALASHALLNDILTDKAKHLLLELRAYVNRDQLDFDPLSSLNGIFSRHSRTPFADILEKEVALRVGGQMVVCDSIKESLGAALVEHMGEAKNRIIEECLESREFKKMQQDQFNRTISQSSAIFRSLSINDICEALLACEKNAFKKDISKKVGLEDGPCL